MTAPQDVAVTYTGTDDPFTDRIYRSGLTFAPGQTRMVPATLEFWQGRPSRLHDRLVYSRTDSTGWNRTRLAP